MNQYFKRLLVVFIVIQGANGVEHERQEPSGSCRSSVQNGLSYVQGQVSSLFTPSRNPTCASVLCKATAGGAFWLASGLIENLERPEYVDPHYTAYSAHGCSLLSTKLLFDAASEVASLIWQKMRLPHLKRDAEKNKVRIRHEYGHISDEKVLNVAIQADKNNLAFLSRIGSHLLYTAMVTHGLHVYTANLDNLIRDGVNPFAFSFPAHIDYCSLSGSILCRPITTPAFLILYTMTLVYNFRELSFAKDPALFIERGSIPFFTYFNGYNTIGFSAALARTIGIDPYKIERMKQVSKVLKNPLFYDNYVKNFSSFDLLLCYGVRNYGNYLLAESLVLTGKNLVDYFKSRPYFEVVEETPHCPKRKRREEEGDGENIRGQKGKGKKKEKKVKLQKQSSPEPDINSSIGDGESYKNSGGGNEDYRRKQSPPKKRKTRGIPDPRKNQGDKRSESPPSSTPPKMSPYKENLRQQGLEAVQALREKYPVNVRDINQIINKLKTFLGAREQPIDGSEYRLIWTLNGRNYALPYEVPHGRDHSVYRDNRLDRILNSLEVGFLFGMEENQVNDYIKENKRYNLLRFPRFVWFLFGHPNK